MYCKLSEKECKMIQNVSNLTRVDYGLINDLIPIDSFISIIYDLLNIIDYKEETIKEIARISSGNITELAIKHAKELKIM